MRKIGKCMIGGFSSTVGSSDLLRRYCNGSPFGYIGASSKRSIWGDMFIERVLRTRGYSYRQIAEWTTSADGKHFADGVYDARNNAETEYIKRWFSRRYRLPR